MTRAKPARPKTSKPGRKNIRHKRHPNDWYVEPAWAVWAILPVLQRIMTPWYLRMLGLHKNVWDPCCGKGTIPLVFRDAGHDVIGTDMVDRGADRTIWGGIRDFFSYERPAKRLRHTSIVSNPPYKRTEEFVRHALEQVENVVAIVVPLNFLCSGGRFSLFMEEHPPLQLAFLSDRPSMPPGDKIEEMGDKAFTGGTIDYVWIIWDNRRPGVRLAPIWVRKPEDAA